MAALPLDFGLQLEQPALEDAQCVGIRMLENGEDARSFNPPLRYAQI